MSDPINVRRIIHVIHACNDYHAVRLRYMNVFGALVFGEGYQPEADRDMNLFYVGDFMIEPMAPRWTKTPTHPMANIFQGYLNRFGEGWHSYEVGVDNVDETVERLKAMNMRISPGVPFTHPLDSFGMSIEIVGGGKYAMRNDPIKHGFDLQNWFRSDHPPYVGGPGFHRAHRVGHHGRAGPSGQRLGGHAHHGRQSYVARAHGSRHRGTRGNALCPHKTHRRARPGNGHDQAPHAGHLLPRLEGGQLGTGQDTPRRRGPAHAKADPPGTRFNSASKRAPAYWAASAYTQTTCSAPATNLSRPKCPQIRAAHPRRVPASRFGVPRARGRRSGIRKGGAGWLATWRERPRS